LRKLKQPVSGLKEKEQRRRDSGAMAAYEKKSQLTKERFTVHLGMKARNLSGHHLSCKEKDNGTKKRDKKKRETSLHAQLLRQIGERTGRKILACPR